MKSLIMGNLTLALCLLSGCGTEVGNGNRMDPYAEKEKEKMPNDTVDESSYDRLIPSFDEDKDVPESVLLLLMNGCAMPFVEYGDAYFEWTVSSSRGKGMEDRKLLVAHADGVWSASFDSEPGALALKFDSAKGMIFRVGPSSTSKVVSAQCSEIRTLPNVEIYGTTYEQKAVTLTFSSGDRWQQHWFYAELNDSVQLGRISFQALTGNDLPINPKVVLDRIVGKDQDNP